MRRNCYLGMVPECVAFWQRFGPKNVQCGVGDIAVKRLKQCHVVNQGAATGVDDECPVRKECEFFGVQDIGCRIRKRQQ